MNGLVNGLANGLVNGLGGLSARSGAAAEHLQRLPRGVLQLAGRDRSAGAARGLPRDEGAPTDQRTPHAKDQRIRQGAFVCLYSFVS